MLKRIATTKALDALRRRIRDRRRNVAGTIWENLPGPGGGASDDAERRELGEQMRQVSLKYVPTAILSRQAGVVRGRALILNLPGQPKAIKETLDGIFPAVPYCIDLIGGPYVETREEICKAFRPKSALKSK